VIVEKMSSDENLTSYKLDLSELVSQFKTSKMQDCFVNINYIGESARLYKNHKGKKLLIADNFYIGKNYTWEIGLKRFVDEEIDFSNLELEIFPLHKDEKIYLEDWPEIQGEKANEIISVDSKYQWAVTLN
jgi:hypothetical protein